jgi:hypothetical protein
MRRAMLGALFLGILAVTIFPTYGWVIPPNPAGEDNYELYGPHVAGVIFRVYPDTTSEWTDMQLHDLDIEDWSLDPAWNATFGAVGGPWTEANYGGEAGYYLFDVNNNATMAATDSGPFLPNPTSDFFMREALAYAANRSDIVALDSTAAPIYTPVPTYMAGYINADLAPGQPGEQYTYGGYTGDTAQAITILDNHYFPIGGDGWRYWDRNHNGVKDAGEDMRLIVYSRPGLRGDYCDHYNNVLNTVLHIKTDYHSHVQRSMVTGPVFAQEDFNIYTGSWTGIGPDIDYLCDLYNGSNYYHPGSPENYAGINYADLNTQLTGIKLATSLAAGTAAAKQAQYLFALHACAIPLWSTSGIKAYANVPVAARAVGNWTDLVNQKGQGVNSWWATLNMHQTGALYPNNYTYYGFSSTVTLQNIVYAQWYWDLEVLGRVYDCGARRDPKTLASWVPQLYKNWTIGTWTDPTNGQIKTQVTVTLRPDAYWQDGQPVTAADVLYTLTEVSKDLLAKGFPPPWWYPTVQYMKSVELLDPYNIQILLDVNSVWAVGWVIGSVVIPKHIWKPIVDASISPTNHPYIQGTTPDPNIIGSGPFRWSSGIGNTVASTVTLVANTPGSVVNGITSLGYYLYYPIWADIGTPNNRVKFNLGTSNANVSIINGITLYNLFQGYTGNYSGDLDVTVRLLVDGAVENVTTGLVIPTWNYTSPYPETGGGSATLDNWVLDTGTNTMQYGLEIDALNPSFHYITVQVQITGPTTILGDGEPNPWLGKWVNVTLPIWVTLKTDIAGSNLFNDMAAIGVPGYAGVPALVTDELPTPDLRVEGRDLSVADKAFGSYPGSPTWNSTCDVNKDYKVDGKDIGAMSRDYSWGFVW